MLAKNPKILEGAVNFEEFYDVYHKEKNTFVLRILSFLYDLYYGMPISDACKKHKITKDTGYKYVRNWKDKGIEGLIPNYGDGRPSKLSENQLSLVKNEIRERKIRNAEDIVNFILKNFKVKYSLSWAYEFIRNLSLEDGINYHLELKKLKKVNKSNKEENKENNKFFIKDDGFKCLNVSKNLYFICYDEVKELESLISAEKNHKILKRYLFVNGLRNGFNLNQMCDILNISISTARVWLKNWNKDGLKGLNIKWGDGRPNLLTDEQYEKVKKYVIDNNVSRYSEIHNFILTNFGVDYSLKHLYRLVKKN